jgi:hypothetical protein
MFFLREKIFGVLDEQKLEFARHESPFLAFFGGNFKARSRCRRLFTGACSKGGEIEGNFHGLRIGRNWATNNPAKSVIVPRTFL